MKDTQHTQTAEQLLRSVASEQWDDLTPPGVFQKPETKSQVGEIFSREHLESYDGSDESAEQIKADTGHKTVHRHFVQPHRDWGGKEEVNTIFDRFDIPEGSTALLIGGYTGEFADVLSDCGMNVIFTDPLSEWCEKADGKGYETYQVPACAIPAQLLDRADFAVTFEAFQPFQGANSTFNMLRLSTLPYGNLLFESEFTREDMDSPVTLLSDYSWLESHYGGDVSYRENNGLRAYSFNTNASASEGANTPSTSVLGYLVPMAVSHLMAETEDSQCLLNQTLLDTAEDEHGIAPFKLYDAASTYWFDYFEHRVKDTVMEQYEPRNRAEGPIGNLTFGAECADERTPPKVWGETDFE